MSDDRHEPTFWVLFGLLVLLLASLVVISATAERVEYPPATTTEETSWSSTP